MESINLTTMFTPKDYLSWLDEEIDRADRMATRENRKYEPNLSYYGRHEALEEARNLFITIQFPSQLTDTKIEDKEP